MPLIYRGSNVIKEITPKELRKIINDEQLKNNNINDPILKNNKNSEKLNENLQEIENEIKSFIPDIDHKNTINEPHNKIVSENSTTGKPPEGSLESAQAQAEQMARLEPRTIHSSTKEEKIEAEMDRLFNNPNDDQSHQIDHESIEEESH
jgi:hypothetical protein